MNLLATSFSSYPCEDPIAEEGPFNFSEYSVLLIEDDPDQLELYNFMLRSTGLRVFGTTSVAEALSLMSRQYIDVVVSDLRMPDRNGFDFIRELRAIRQIPASAKQVPVILLTACSNNIEFAALKVGADMFCEKKNATKLLTKQIRFLLE